MGGDFAFDARCDLALIAWCVKALVALHIGKEAGVVSAAPGAGDASSGGGVEGGIFAVKRRVREIQVQVGLNPRRKVFRRKQVGLLVLPVLAPALLIGFRLALLR